MTCPRFTPPGYAPCTRDPGHDGPCAHPLTMTVELNAMEARVVVTLINIVADRPPAWASWIDRHLHALKEKCEAIQ